MRVLCLHPNNNNNIGDQLTYLGTKYLLKRALGDIEFVQFDIQRCEREFDTYIPEFDWGPVDLIVLAGSPWVGTTNAGGKHRMLQQAIQKFPDAKRLGLGLGSFCSHDSLMNREKIFNADVAKSLQIFKNFNLILTRDYIAHDVLEFAGVQNVLTFDTSVYAKHYSKGDSKKTDKTALVYYDPFLRDVWSHLSREEWNRYIDYEIEISNKHNPDIFGVSVDERQSAKDHLNKDLHFVADIEWMAKKISTYKTVYSGRVHQAILAKIMGVEEVYIMPVDSRFLTATNVGIPRYEKCVGRFKEVPVKAPQRTCAELTEALEKEEKVIVVKIQEAIK